MRILVSAKGLLVGIIVCAITGWWLLPTPPTQADTLRVPNGDTTEFPVGRVLSPAIGGTKNPTSSTGNPIKPAMPAAMPAADTGCYILRGDMDHSGAHDIADLTYTVDYLFLGGPPPVCAEEGDVDASGELDISDLTYFVAYLFLGGPIPPIPQGKDFVFWFENRGTFDLQYFGYHSLTHQIDTLTLDTNIFEVGGKLAVSPDGQTLYLSRSYKIYIYDLLQSQIVDSLPYTTSGGMAVSPDGQLLAVQASSLLILSTSNYSVLYQDTSNVFNGVFSSDSRTFYGVAESYEGSIKHAFRFNLDSLTIIHKSFADGGPIRMLPSQDESLWFLYLFCGSFCNNFEVYDVAADSIIFKDFITPGAGYMALTPDNRYLFYTNQGSMMGGPIAPSYFKGYDRTINDIGVVIGTSGDAQCTSSEGHYPVGEIAVSPDGNWLVVIRFGGSSMKLINLKTMEVEECVYLPNVAPWNLTCQSLP